MSSQLKKFVARYSITKVKEEKKVFVEDVGDSSEEVITQAKSKKRKLTPKNEKKTKTKREAIDVTNVRGVKDFLEGDQVDLVIIGFNPGIKSGTLGHHYANPCNHFYKLLRQSGLVHSSVTCKDDSSFPERFHIGLTNLVDRTTRSSSDLTKEDMKSGAVTLLNKLDHFLKNPNITVCFNGMAIFEACLAQARKALEQKDEGDGEPVKKRGKKVPFQIGFQERGGKI
ncbi:hypothetical protein PROFUN_03620 [Planoprotostelium fungivorum]|uniref:Uracil-DNA glycosylase-like domain-containing protein n=1 Tax=Planoprotostelium fungivorum TaxID=1890364 RepID=A0A2P6NSC0_9EUKA|nr:hypothetical protein PROFUN_03620 [Planoprotostelium fungivorum]